MFVRCLGGRARRVGFSFGREAFLVVGGRGIVATSGLGFGMLVGLASVFDFRMGLFAPKMFSRFARAQKVFSGDLSWGWGGFSGVRFGNLGALGGCGSSLVSLFLLLPVPSPWLPPVSLRSLPFPSSLN